MKKMLRSKSESGQIVVVLATALFFVMLGAGAVVIDMGNGFLNRQRLQNTADAAALAAAYRLAAGGTHSDAVTVAQNIVSQNTAGTVTLTDLGTGSDPNITSGIQTSGTDVRVALTKSDVRTFFSRVIGVNNLTVGARSRAKVNAGAGLLPIAIKRYSRGNTLYDLGAPRNPNSVTDYIAREGSGNISAHWPSPWPNLLTSPPPSGSRASTTNRGPEIPILGHDALANEAQGNDFHFWVAPDARNITWSYPPGPTYTNGVTAGMSIQDLKGLETTYFSATRAGYSSLEGLPQVGDQVAILNGVDTDNTVAEMEKFYPVGKQIVAMVYDGTVHRKPEFQLLITPIFSQDNHTPRAEVQYQVTLHQTNGSYPYFGTNIGLSVVGLDGFANWNFSANPVNVMGTDVTTTLTISAAHPNDPTALDPTPKTTGVKSFLVKAYDNLNHIQRTATAGILFGADSGFVATCNSAYVQAEQGSSGHFTVDLTGYNGYNGNVTLGAPGWEGADPSGAIKPGYSSHNPWTITSETEHVWDPHTSSIDVYFDVEPSAFPGEYIMKIPMTDGTLPTQYMYLSIEVVPDSAGTTVGNAVSFVYIIGFAAFEITDYQHNTAFGRAISDLVSDPSTLTVGSAVRLVGWTQ